MCCLEGSLYSALSSIPIVKDFAPFISLLILVAALVIAFAAKSVAHFICALYCPLTYLLYHYATKSSKIKDNS